jgi:hypothetical protein
VVVVIVAVAVAVAVAVVVVVVVEVQVAIVIVVVEVQVLLKDVNVLIVKPKYRIIHQRINMKIPVNIVRAIVIVIKENPKVIESIVEQAVIITQI